MLLASFTGRPATGTWMSPLPDSFLCLHDAYFLLVISRTGHAEIGLRAFVDAQPDFGPVTGQPALYVIVRGMSRAGFHRFHRPWSNRISMRNAIVRPPIINTVYIISVYDRHGGSAKEIVLPAGRSLFRRKKQTPDCPHGRMAGSARRRGREAVVYVRLSGGFENTFQCIDGAGVGRG